MLFWPLSSVLFVCFFPIVLYKLNIYQKGLIIEARKRAFKEAALIAKDIGDFELHDTEGRGGERLNRARIAFEIELELRSLSNQKRC